MDEGSAQRARAFDTQDLFEKLFEFSPDAILVIDRQGRIGQANPRVEELFGYSREDLMGQHVEVLIPERFRDAHLGHRKDYNEHPRTRPMGTGLELYGRRKDGSEFPVDVMLTPVETGEGPFVLCAIRDASERKGAEDALRQSEQRFRMLFEFSPDAVIVSDREGRITEANVRVESLFGYSRGELLGQPVEILIPERFRQVHPKCRAEYDNQPRMRPMGVGLELYGQRKDRSEFPVDIMLGPVETQNDRVVVHVIRDLSERRRYEQALRRSEEEKRYLEEELNLEYQFGEIIGESAEIRRVLKQVETVAVTDATVLILGETGTGKDLIARAIHQLSSRHERTLFKLNCTAIPTGLLESELFGHEKGAFTGAISQRIGRLELAHQGTLFLDEIGDLLLELQPKILRALQEKEFERLGGTRTIPVDVRLIAATNRDLAKMVADRQFRSDLYYRLKVFPIVLPPLRKRREDIPLLVRHFVGKYARQMDKVIENIPCDAMQALVQCSWPGNIRELENFIERAVILTKGPTLRAPLAELETAEEPALQTDPTLKDAEREHILRALREARGAVGGPRGAATRLGLKRTTLNSKLKKLGINPKDFA